MTTVREPEREELLEAADELDTALCRMADAIRRAGGRESQSDVVRRFAAYQLADLEGEERGWLGSGHLIDALREASRGGWKDFDEEDERLDAMERRARVE